MSNKVYTATWEETVNAGITYESNFNIDSPGKEIKIKSIALTWRIEEIATGILIPTDTTTDQRLYLMVGQANKKIASDFVYITGIPLYKADIIRIFKPMQYFFDSFFITNNLLFRLQINNLSAAQKKHIVSLIVETEEKQMYQ